MSFQAILNYLNTIWNTYPIEFILLILTGMYTIVRTINDLLPNKYKINKRLNFLIKISKVICRIKVSIPVKEPHTFEELKNKFSNFWSKATSNVREDGLPISFYSNSSGSAYEVSTFEDTEESKNFVTLDNFNGFNIGLFGGIKNLDIVLDEIHKITELFNNERDGNDKIIIEISITPRIKKFSDNNLNANYSKDNFSCSYNCKDITLVNKGYSSLKKNISNTIYEWMSHFV